MEELNFDKVFEEDLTQFLKTISKNEKRKKKKRKSSKIEIPPLPPPPVKTFYLPSNDNNNTTTNKSSSSSSSSSAQKFIPPPPSISTIIYSRAKENEIELDELETLLETEDSDEEEELLNLPKKEIKELERTEDVGAVDYIYEDPFREMFEEEEKLANLYFKEDLELYEGTFGEPKTSISRCKEILLTNDEEEELASWIISRNLEGHQVNFFDIKRKARNICRGRHYIREFTTQWCIYFARRHPEIPPLKGFYDYIITKCNYLTSKQNQKLREKIKTEHQNTGKKLPLKKIIEYALEIWQTLDEEEQNNQQTPKNTKRDVFGFHWYIYLKYGPLASDRRNLNPSQIYYRFEKELVTWINSTFQSRKKNLSLPPLPKYKKVSTFLFTANELRLKATELAKKNDPNVEPLNHLWLKGFLNQYRRLLPKELILRDDHFMLLEVDELVLADWLKKESETRQVRNYEIKQKALELARSKDPSILPLSFEWLSGFRSRHPELHFFQEETSFWEEEEELEEWIQMKSNFHVQLNRLDIYSKALRLFKIKNPKKFHLTKKWFARFYNRHPMIRHYLKDQQLFWRENIESVPGGKEELIEWVKEQNEQGIYPKLKMVSEKKNEIVQKFFPARLPYHPNQKIKDKFPDLKFHSRETMPITYVISEEDLIQWIQTRQGEGHQVFLEDIQSFLEEPFSKWKNVPFFDVRIQAFLNQHPELGIECSDLKKTFLDEELTNWIEETMKTKESGEKMSSLEVKTKATEILRRTIPNYPLLTRWWYKNFRQRNPNLSIYLGKKPNFCVERIIKRVKSIQELIAWIEERYNQCDPPTVEEVCELAGTIYHPTNNQSMTFKWFRNFINTNPSLYHIFSPINENKLVVWIQEQLNCGKEVTRVEFQEMVYQELREKGIPSQSFNMTLWINHFETENQHLLTQYSSSSNSNTSDIYLGVKNWVEENFKDTPISFATLKEVFTKIKRKIHPASAPVSKRQISLLLKKFPELKSKIASYFEEDSDPQRGLKKPISISRKRTFSELNEMENNENIENPRRKKPKKEDKT